jgi:phage terminase small subunit
MGGRYPKVAESADSNVYQFPGSTEAKSLSEKDIKDLVRKHRPKDLTKEQGKVWLRVMPEFIRAGRFKPLFVEFFKQYAVVVERMERQLTYLDHMGWKYVTEGRNGEQHKTRPEASQYNDDWRKWNSLVNQIGMSPATDQRFHNLQPDLFDDDPY